MHLTHRNWKKSICFAGGITKQWLHENVIKALDETTNITYKLAGNKDESYFKKLINLESWHKVDYVGRIPYVKVASFISESTVGIALNDNYRDIINLAKHRYIFDGRYKLIYMPMKNKVIYEMYDTKKDPSPEGSA